MCLECFATRLVFSMTGFERFRRTNRLDTPRYSVTNHYTVAYVSMSESVKHSLYPRPFSPPIETSISRVNSLLPFLRNIFFISWCYWERDNFLVTNPDLRTCFRSSLSPFPSPSLSLSLSPSLPPSLPPSLSPSLPLSWNHPALQESIDRVRPRYPEETRESSCIRKWFIANQRTDALQFGKWNVIVLSCHVSTLFHP